MQDEKKPILTLEGIKDLSMYENVDYFDRLIEEYTRLRNAFVYEPSDKACDISYSKYVNWHGALEGAMTKFKFQQYKIKEQKKLRAGSKNYNVLYRQDGKLMQIDHYVNGRLDVIYKAYYTENKRYLFPFFANGSPYPTYGVVAVFKEGKLVEEMLVDHQLIFYDYRYMGDRITLTYIDYVPSGTEYKLLEKASGIFQISDTLEYTTLYRLNYLDLEASSL